MQTILIKAYCVNVVEPIYLNKCYLRQNKIYYLDELYLCTEAVVQRCSVKKVFLEISQSSQEKARLPEFLFYKVGGLSPATLLKKEALARVFSCEFYKNF